MRANTKKRKIFEDALDLMVGGEPERGDGVQMIPIGEICAFHDHPFRLYDGERLEDMVESVKVHGVLSPVIIREIGEPDRNGQGDSCLTLCREDGDDCKYEMLSGHNRMNAARIAGLAEIPAIVKKGITEEEAFIYVMETNVIQRSFSELLPSEKAAVMSEHYQKICGTMKRKQIMEELCRLSGKRIDEDDFACGCGRNPQVRTRDIVAEEYGFSSRNAARYLRINYLIKPVRELVDDGKLGIAAAVDISYLDDSEQELVYSVASKTGGKITSSNAMEIRKQSGSLTKETLEEMLVVPENKVQGISVTINSALREKYFMGLSRREITDLIDRAMEVWIQSTSQTKMNPAS